MYTHHTTLDSSCVRKFDRLRNKLEGDDGLLWDIAFDRFLEKKDVVWGDAHMFPTWKTIRFDCRANNEDIVASLAEAGCNISETAHEILAKMDGVSAKISVELLRVTVAELGFFHGARWSYIYARARLLGFELCPPEIGPQLRLCYRDQPNNEWLYVAMKPIVGVSLRRSVFCVVRWGAELWLCDDFGYPDNFWYGGAKIVFTRRHNKE